MQKSDTRTNTGIFNRPLSTDNAYAGGITYSTPAYVLGGTGAVNGGYAFDLPLATVAAFNAQGLDFLSSSTQNNMGFLQGVIDGNSNALAFTENRAFSLAESGIGLLADLSYAGIASQQQMNQFNQEQATQRVAMMPEPDSGGFCFITTAVCEVAGLPDDCETLQILREFRDGYMSETLERFLLVVHYYEIAPGIVERLKARHDGGEKIFGQLKTHFIDRAVKLIQSGKHHDAMTVYREMVEFALNRSGGA